MIAPANLEIVSENRVSLGDVHPNVTILKAFPTNAIGFLALSQARWLLGVDEGSG